MGGIPFLNIMAILHLCFIAAFVGAVMTENVMELNVFVNRKNGIGASGASLRLLKLRNHYCIDSMVEIPLAIGVVASGITLAILVDRLSVLPIGKIVLASGAMNCTRYPWGPR